MIYSGKGRDRESDCRSPPAPRQQRMDIPVEQSYPWDHHCEGKSPCNEHWRENWKSNGSCSQVWESETLLKKSKVSSTISINGGDSLDLPKQLTLQPRLREQDMSYKSLWLVFSGNNKGRDQCLLLEKTVITISPINLHNLLDRRTGSKILLKREKQLRQKIEIFKSYIFTPNKIMLTIKRLF